MNINYDNEQEESGFNCLYSIKENWEERKNIIEGLIEEIDENSLDIIEICAQYSKGIATQLTDLRSAIVLLTSNMLIKLVNKFKKNSKSFFDKFLNESKLYESICCAQKIISDKSHQVILNVIKNGIVSFKEMSRIRDLRLNKNKNVRAKIAEYYYNFVIHGIDSNKYFKEILKEIDPLTIDADQNARKFSKNTKKLILENEENINISSKSNLKKEISKKPKFKKQDSSFDKTNYKDKKINSNKNITINNKKDKIDTYYNRNDKKNLTEINTKKTTKYQNIKTENLDFDKKFSKIEILVNSLMPNQKTIGVKKLNKLLNETNLKEYQINKIINILLKNLNFKNVELQKLVFKIIFDFINEKNPKEQIQILSINMDIVVEFITQNYDEVNFEKGIEFLIDLIIDNEGWRFLLNNIFKKKNKCSLINKIKLSQAIIENNNNTLNSKESIQFLIKYYKKFLFEDKIQDNKIIKLIAENLLDWEEYFYKNEKELQDLCQNKELMIILKNTKQFNNLLKDKEIKKVTKVKINTDKKMDDTKKLEEVIEKSDLETRIAIINGLKTQIKKSSTSNQSSKNKIVNKIITIIDHIINLCINNNDNIIENGILDLSLKVYKDLFSQLKLNNNQINMMFDSIFNILFLMDGLYNIIAEFILSIKIKQILNKILENISEENLLIQNLILFSTLMYKARNNNKNVWFLKEIGNYIESIIELFKELFKNSEVKIRKQVVLCLVEFYHFLSTDSFNQLMDQFSKENKKLVNEYINKNN